MKYRLEIKEEAKKDILDAVLCYTFAAQGLNLRFIEQLEIVIKTILNNPKTYKRIYFMGIINELF